MKKYHFFAFLLCGVFTSRGLSLPFRNFSIDCETLVPDHPAEPQESESPYHITLPLEEYDLGSQVKVGIEGPPDVGFKWFMLQARDIDENVPVGSFQITDPNTQTYDCYNMSNSALIHQGSGKKYNVTSLWVSPEAKKVQFVATIFQDPETYWVVIPGVVLFPKGYNETENDTEVVDRSKEASAPRSRKKSSRITVKIDCGQGGSGSSSSECAKSSTFPSQSGSSQGQGVVVYQGGIKSSGCIGGGTASVYNKYGCTDSVSGVSNKGKVIVYPPSEPFPPERNTYPSQLANSGYKPIQGLRPQSGIRVTIQGGPICDKTSSSYNSQACKMSIQSSSSQSSSSYGSQGGSSVIVGSSGSSPSVGVSGTTIKISSGGSPSSVGGGSGTSFGNRGSSTSISGSGTSITVSSSGSSASVGSSGSSSSSGGNPCGQGYTYNGSPCKPGVQSGSFGSSSSQYGQGGQSGSFGGGSQYGQGGQSGSYGGSSQYGQGGQSGSYGSSSQYGQGGQSGSYGGSSQYGQGGQSGSYGGGSQYGQDGQSGSYGSSSQYGQGGQSGSYGGGSQYGQGGQSGSFGSSSQYGQGGKGGSSGSSQYGQSASYGSSSSSSSQYGQSGSYGGSSQYGQGGQSGTYGSSSQFGQGSQAGGRYSGNDCLPGDASRYGAQALSSTNCRRKRDIAAQETFKAFIRKIRENKAPPRALIRRIRSEKVSTADF